jgi:hypothetical protein
MPIEDQKVRTGYERKVSVSLDGTRDVQLRCRGCVAHRSCELAANTPTSTVASDAWDSLRNLGSVGVRREKRDCEERGE